MKLTKKELTKRIQELEERVRQLEEAERQRNLITITLPKQEPQIQPLPYYPERTWPGTIIIEPCSHEFPSHYYSPDGYYPCMKCGKSFRVGTVITCSTTNQLQ